MVVTTRIRITMQHRSPRRHAIDPGQRGSGWAGPARPGHDAGRPEFTVATLTLSRLIMAAALLSSRPGRSLQWERLRLRLASRRERKAALCIDSGYPIDVTSGPPRKRLA